MIQYTKIVSNERAQPSTSAPILRTLPIGTSLDVTYIGNGWARINRPVPLLPSFIATSSLTDTNPNQTNWFSGMFTDTPTPTTTPVTTYSVVTTPTTTPTKTTTKPATTPATTPATVPTPEPEKNNTIWYVLGGAALIGIYYFFKKRK